MKTLYFGTTYIRDMDDAFKLRAWDSIAVQQVECDKLLIDSCSPVNPFRIVSTGNRIVTLPSNIGHNGVPGQGDGWGRAFCKGIELAIEGGYDYAVFVEGDMLCAVDYRDVIHHMQREGKAFAAPFCPQVNAIETGLMYMDVKRLKELDFVKRYDWETLRYPEHCEDRVQKIFGADWLLLPFTGGRMEYEEDVLWNNGDDRPCYLTHARPWVYDLYTRTRTRNSRPLMRWNDPQSPNFVMDSATRTVEAC